MLNFIKRYKPISYIIILLSLSTLLFVVFYPESKLNFKKIFGGKWTLIMVLPGNEKELYISERKDGYWSPESCHKAGEKNYQLLGNHYCGYKCSKEPIRPIRCDTVKSHGLSTGSSDFIIGNSYSN